MTGPRRLPRATSYTCGVRIWQGLGEVAPDLQASVVTIGVFDGVHRGHQKLITTAVRHARELGIPAVLMTFDPHPVQVFAPERAPQLLGTLDDRIRRAADLGIDYFLTVSFTPELARLSPLEYINDVLIGLLHARTVVVGQNFTFGHKAAGTADTLREYAANHELTVDIVPLLTEPVPEGLQVEMDGTAAHSGAPQTISSTFTRRQLRAGNVAAAAWALGRNYAVTSEVEHGAGRGGAELGFPTANLYIAPTRALPVDGVYAGWVTIHDNGMPIDGTIEPGKKYPAAVSVGLNPTFGDERRSVEAFILDEHADLYGRIATVEFVDYLRGMKKFDGIDALLEAIGNDVTHTRKALQIA